MDHPVSDLNLVIASAYIQATLSEIFTLISVLHLLLFIQSFHLLASLFNPYICPSLQILPSLRTDNLSYMQTMF